ncbi:MAG: penicillin-binding protein 2 [Anaerolineaceae bacterium]|jgi:penicillin-binding protein 2|nr:penicillin-binding protein 2 [Anaerolineaceae bacterium]
MNEQEYKKPTINMGRFRWIYVIIALTFIYYASQLFNYQIIEGDTYLAQAEDNRTNVISIPTQRGMIYDRNGVILARNTAQYNVTVTPAELPDSAGEIREIFDELSQLVDIPVNQGEVNDQTASAFTPCYTDLGIFQIVEIAESLWPFQPTRLKCNLTKETAMVIEEKKMDWPGIDVEVESIREYPTGEQTAEIIGFLGPIPEVLLDYYTDLGFVSGRDKVGYMGIENSMQDVLAGTNGRRVVEVTVGGEVVRDIEEPIEPVPGADIHLTIDYRLQMAARAALIEQLRYWNEFWMRERGEVMSTTGTVVGMNPKTGELLFMVSYPNYENNRMAQIIPGYYYEQLSIDEAKPLVNKAISSELPPGSVFKMVPALGVLNEEIVTPEETIGCTPTITLRQQFYESDIGTEQSYYCHDDAGHGAVDYEHGIGYSCNVYWYKTSGGYPGEVEDGGLGIWNIFEYGAALGYGKTTGIELPGEADGLLPNPTWKRLNQGENWATGDTYLAGVGQGYVLATPVQVMNAFSTIVNGGKHLQLSMIGKTVDAEGNIVQSFEPELLWDITQDPLIHTYEGNNQTSEVKTVESWVIDLAMRGMELVTSQEGTAKIEFEGDQNKIAGKTGTAEYCDDWANREGLCIPGSWPSHAWFAGYAPYDDPEIVVVSFVYNGREGSTVSGPIVRKIIDAYFEFKAIDAELEGLNTGD